jgi:2-polyprenyl-3-methyl-5-hydroxy-6-metoxy-1,4-benzoquinol methylase
MPSNKTMISATPETLNAVAREVRNLQSASGRSAAGNFPAAAAGGSLDEGLAYEIEKFARSFSNPAHAIGRMPPEPPTLRGRAGAALVRLVKRCLFWYSDQINEMYAKTGDLFRRVSVQLSQLDRERDSQRQFMQDLASEVGALKQATKTIREDITESGNSLAMTRQDLAQVRSTLPQDFNALLRAALEKERTTVRQEFEAALRNDRQLLQNDLASRLHVEKEISAIRQEFESALQNDRLVLRHESESKLAELRESLRKAEMLLHQTRATLYAQESRISLLMLKSNRSAEDTPLVKAPESAADVSCDELGPAYLAFENLFRGPRDEIKERVSEYLPLLAGKRIGSPQMPVLDLGCGRGEWLEVLGDHGLTAMGVDSNQTQVHEGHVRGLNVRVADALSFLAELPEQSQGAVTAFHVVEHMPFRTILNLLDEAVRVLKPGGLLILETPNPANLIVGANTFYLDPTHIRPIPADLLRFFVEARGFCNVEIRPLHPFPDCFRLDGEPNSAASVLNDLVYGPRDYAIVAERP